MMQQLALKMFFVPVTANMLLSNVLSTSLRVQPPLMAHCLLVVM
jgi:hypothetical protein